MNTSTQSSAVQRSARAQQAYDLVAQVPDPEIPVVSLFDLGILRDVTDGPGGLCVILTPTYSGCPATEAIAQDVRKVLSDSGLNEARVDIKLSPAWTSDWMSVEGREKLKAYGITPPSCSAAEAQQVIALRRKISVSCPRCNSNQTEQLSNFGSTPCKSLYRCLICREPFDYFKPY